MQIYVSGSMACDRIMNFPGRFSDHILPEKIHTLSVSFTVSSLVERTGGTAGNIACSLTVLGRLPHNGPPSDNRKAKPLTGRGKER